MLCRCIIAGTARIVGRAKPRWVEPGEIHDVVLNDGDGIPANFESADAPAPPPPPKRGRGKVKDTDDL